MKIRKEDSPEGYTLVSSHWRRKNIEYDNEYKGKTHHSNFLKDFIGYYILTGISLAMIVMAIENIKPEGFFSFWGGGLLFIGLICLTFLVIFYYNLFFKNQNIFNS